MHRFDPQRVGERECRAWETYYRRKWGAFLVASIGMVRAAFGMSWPRTILGAWLVLRAGVSCKRWHDLDASGGANVAPFVAPIPGVT